MPAISGTAGRPPVAMQAFKKVSCYPFTSAVLGPVNFACPRKTSTPSAFANRCAESAAEIRALI